MRRWRPEPGGHSAIESTGLNGPTCGNGRTGLLGTRGARSNLLRASDTHPKGRNAVRFMGSAIRKEAPASSPGKGGAGV